MRALLLIVLLTGLAGCAALTHEERLSRQHELRAACLTDNSPTSTVTGVWDEQTLRCSFVANHPRGNIAEPIIDKGVPGFDATQYATDLTACRGYANQIAGQTLDGALGGALLGAAFGAIVDSSFDTSGGARAGALSGGLGGAVQGNASSHQGRALVVRKCLAGRGYSVLDF